jgi:predicted ChrR family anti-sigma factor
LEKKWLETKHATMIQNIHHTLLTNLTVQNYHELEWQRFREGVSIYPLYTSENSAASAAMLKYVAGASVPEHLHAGYEHIFVLEGSQEDERGIYRKGDLVINHPGSHHWVRSNEGCVVLAIWEKPVEFLNPEP